MFLWICWSTLDFWPIFMILNICISNKIFVYVFYCLFLFILFYCVKILNFSDIWGIFSITFYFLFFLFNTLFFYFVLILLSFWLQWLRKYPPSSFCWYRLSLNIFNSLSIVMPSAGFILIFEWKQMVNWIISIKNFQFFRFRSWTFRTDCIVLIIDDRYSSW